MRTTEFVSAVLLKATGKARVLQTTDAKYQKIFSLGNLYIQQWQNEPNVDWDSLYDPSYQVGSISATNSYDLDLDEIQKMSDTPGDFVVIRKGDLTYEYAVVSPVQLKSYKGGNFCAHAGERLLFAKNFTAESPEFGGVIEVPVYTFAPLLKNPTSRIPVDLPMWLVLMTAAEYARNDTLLQNQYGNLVNEANQLMQKMIENNGAQVQHLYSPSVPGISDI